MNLLYVAPRVPYPPHKGDKTRVFHHIRELAKRHTVHLVCRIDERDDPDGLRALTRYCRTIDAVREPRSAVRLRAARALLRGRSHTAFAHASTSLCERITQRRRAEALDAILVATTAMAETVRGIADLPKALDLVDVVSELWEGTALFHVFPVSWLHRLEASRLRRYEHEVARTFDRSIVASEAEARAFRQRTFGAVSVIGNGVDLDYFTPRRADASAAAEGPLVVFTGTMDYFPNVDAVRHFCRSIFPLVRTVVPAARCHIVGRDPTRPVRALAQRGSVTVTGSVPDVREHLANATVAVAPLRVGRGVQNKVLEAMAMGIPVVASSLALEGLAVTEGDGVRRADDPETFAREIVHLLRDSGWRQQCSRLARRYVERHHRWETHGACLSDVLESMVEDRRRLAGGAGVQR